LENYFKLIDKKLSTLKCYVTEKQTVICLIVKKSLPKVKIIVRSCLKLAGVKNQFLEQYFANKMGKN
jgi:hypothetical protein